MDYNLILTEKNGVVFYGYFCDGKPLELYCEKKEQSSILGNIYAARVEKIADGIGGAFLEIENGKKCYYPLSGAKKPVKLTPGHEDRLYGGDVILVQIVKDAVKTKLAVADSNISFPGKYFVLTLSDHRLSLSKKITDKEERDRLQTIAQPYCSGEYGFVVRTNAAGTEEAALKKELKELTEKYLELMRRAKTAPGKTLLYRNPPHYITMGQDLPEAELTKVLTDREDIFEELSSYYSRKGDRGFLDKLIFYKDTYPLEKLYRLNTFYQRALDKTVWLSSGGSLVIEKTEAMTVIDVNTGCVTRGKKKAMELFYRMNCEAAKEIAAQLRLRNLSGIILIDFINMKDNEQKEKLLSLLTLECSKDRVPTRVIDMTALNLVEMTRNKVRKPLHEQWDECRFALKNERD